MVLVYSPYFEVLWKKLPNTLDNIKSAGFDGVEGHLIGNLRSNKRIVEVRDQVSGLGLGLRLHQGWSWANGQLIIENMILGLCGALVPNNMSLAEQTNGANKDSVVVYGSSLNELISANYLYQTASVYAKGGSYVSHFGKFVETVKKCQLPVVFDTQHVLEWFWNKKGVEDLPSDPDVINYVIGEIWQEIGQYVREIHLCDFNPKLGSSKGRNVFLGDGVFPLKEFCANIRASGWEGVVTPEVAPRHIRGVKDLQVLCEKVHELFY